MTKGLTRSMVVEAALAVLDESGIDALTVRSVAERLGVKAPALYWHFQDKQALLDEMGTVVWRAIAAESSLGAFPDWRAACAAYARTARRGLLAHRDGARVFSGTRLTDVQVLRDQEAGLVWMGQQGFSVAAATDAFVILNSFVVGYCIEEQARLQAPAGQYSPADRAARIGAADHPLAAASGWRMFSGDGDIYFETLLAVVLDGIAGLRTTGS